MIFVFGSGRGGGGAGALTGFVSNIKTFAYDTKIKIWWTDPEDENWSGTRLVRKEGSYPTNAGDGEIVLDSKVRNQYNYVSDDSEAFEDTGLVTGTQYYYCLFPYSKSNQFTADVSGQFTQTAKQTIFFITFMSEGEEKYKCKVNAGDTPSYAGDPITQNKAGDRDFDEWSPKIYAADKDQTYNATFKVFLTYKHYDGTGADLHKEQVKHGGEGTWAGTDTRDATAQYTYTFAGWTLTTNGAVNANARKNLQVDTVVYSAFTQTTRKYDITWKNYDGTTLKTEQVEYGKTPSYTGTTPSFNGWKFTGWNPTPKAVTGPATYYATYTLPSGMTETITKNWDEVIADAKAGTTSGYTAGGTKVMILTDKTAWCVEWAGIKATSGATFDILSRTVGDTCQWNTSRTTQNGYPSSNLKKVIEGYGDKFPANIKAAVKSVTKYCYCASPKNANLSYTAKYWAPSYREMNYGTDKETSGAQYTYYNTDSRRIRYTSTGSAAWAWLSSAYDSTYAYGVNGYGDWGGYDADYAGGAPVLGFCL